MAQKNNKKIGIGVILAGVLILAGIQFLDIRVFDKLSPFNKDPDASVNQTGNEQVAQNLSAAFAGRWQVARPEGEGVIVNKPMVTCDNPVVITAEKPDTVLFTPANSTTIKFELTAYDGRVTWYPQVGDTSIAEIKSDDVFWLYQTRLGKADWANPNEYRKCK